MGKLPDVDGFRVMHVTDYASSYEGAFIRQLRMLDDEVRSRGGRSSALCLTQAAHDQSWSRVLEDDGWQLQVIPDGSTRSQAGVARAIADAVLQLRPDVVHVHFGTFDLSTRRALLMLRRSLGSATPKLVWHYRTALESRIEERSRLRRIKDYAKFSRAGSDVDMFVSVTRALADEVSLRGAASDRVRAVVAGCDTERFCRHQQNRVRIREALGLSDDDVFLLHMGWSWHRKGGDLLAEALRMLEVGSQTRIVAYSIGAPEDALLGSVKVLPMTDRVHEYHQASDIFVSASRSEGFGNGLVEAMACERVAVAAVAEGQIETFRGLDGVRPVPVENADAIASSVRTLIHERSSWANLGRSNRQHVVEHHSMRRWAHEMADAYAYLQPKRLRSGATSGREVA